MKNNNLYWLLFIAFLVISKLATSQPDTTGFKAMVYKHCKHPEIVMAQAVLESGNFKCNNCSWDYNNPFGFFWRGEYKKWDSWQQSIIYYRNWQSKLYKGGDYYEFLKRVGYAEDPNYINKLKQIVNEQ